MKHLRVLILSVVSVFLVMGYAGQAYAARWTTDFGESLDSLLDSAASFLVGQRKADSSLTSASCKDFLMQDMSNENIASYSAEQIISRSGYDFETHLVTSDDGYITQLVRIINPLADRGQLKQPPVMMMHGGITDITSWIFSSSIQHHPERWPRTPDDGPITSWNNSLAFVLANNGYDVWLVGTRGSNLQNKRHTKLKNHLNWFDQADRDDREHGGGGRREGALERNVHLTMNFGENFRYWNYTMDDIGRYEVPRQQEKILEVTGAANVTLVDFSFGTMINLALMSENPVYVSRLHNYFTMAPIVNNRGANLFVRSVQNPLATRLPLPIGNIIAQMILSPPMRSLIAQLSSFRELRYTLTKMFTRIIAGPSGQFETNLDSGVVGHLYMSTGYKQIRHYSQQVMAGRLQKFDHGRTRNMRAYGSPRPPKYDLSKIRLPNWMLVSAGNDLLATVDSVKQMLGSVGRAPDRHVHIERFNHLDLIAAVENDIHVNLPALDFLDSLALPPQSPQSPQETLDDYSRDNEIHSTN